MQEEGGGGGLFGWWLLGEGELGGEEARFEVSVGSCAGGGEEVGKAAGN